MLIGGRGLLDKLLVPSLHRHIPHIVSDVLRLKQFSYHSHKDPIKKMDNNEKNIKDHYKFKLFINLINMIAP